MYGFDFTIMAHTIEAMAGDDSIDAIIPYFSLDFITSFQNAQIESGPHIIAEACRKTDKPVIPILSKFTENILEVESSRIKMTAAFRNAGMAVFSTPQDALASIAGILRWNLIRSELATQGEPEAATG